MINSCPSKVKVLSWFQTHSQGLLFQGCSQYSLFNCYLLNLQWPCQQKRFVLNPIHSQDIQKKDVRTSLFAIKRNEKLWLHKRHLVVKRNWNNSSSLMLRQRPEVSSIRDVFVSDIKMKHDITDSAVISRWMKCFPIILIWLCDSRLDRFVISIFL